MPDSAVEGRAVGGPSRQQGAAWLGWRHWAWCLYLEGQGSMGQQHSLGIGRLWLGSEGQQSEQGQGIHM